MYLEHNVTEDIVRECFSTLMLEVVPELPNNLSHGLPSSLSKDGLVPFEEGVQVNIFQHFWREKLHH